MGEEIWVKVLGVDDRGKIRLSRKAAMVELAAVTPGRDSGNQIEIVAGIKPGDQVIINPPDSIVSGQRVQIVQATLPGDIK